ncbi:hypothetical protein SAY86_005718 [Trapa natans]|uniref:GTD-binding domain-containing protein n=1 Tax=Trapa natans TaxID=22666 RepID=A0AAN7L1Y6_TRANT|nr:hypothetical protein SAY86_005718 [Trapa natans]
MAANKFATMLHRNTNKITLILIYAVLEWVLIVLLLLNSLFSYLIIRFAEFFGLERPCPWCSRLDHLFDSRDLHLRDLVCHRHAAEISRLRFCSGHRRLAELSDLCEECLSSLGPDEDGGDSSLSENGELMNSLKCSCCGVSLERKLICCSRQEDRDLSCIQEQGCVVDQSLSDALLEDLRADDQCDDEFGEFKAADSCVRDEAITVEEEKVVLVMEKKEGEDFNVFDVTKDNSTSNQTVLLQDETWKEKSARASSGCHLEFFIGRDDCELIPVEWTDTINVRGYPRLSPIMEEDHENSAGYEDVIMDFCPPSARKPDLFTVNISSENTSEGSQSVKGTEILANVSEEEEGSSTQEVDGQTAAAQNGNENGESLLQEGETGMSKDDPASDEESASQIDEAEAEVSIGTEIPDQEHIDANEIHEEDTIPWDPCTDGDRDISHAFSYYNHGVNEGETVEFRTNFVEMIEEVPNHQPDLYGEVSGGSDGDTLEFRTNSVERRTESLNYQSNLFREDTGSHGATVEFTTNSIETIQESLDYRSDICEVGSGGDTLDFRTNMLKMTKEAPDLQSDLCREDLRGIERDTLEVETNLVQTSEEVAVSGGSHEVTLEFRTNSVEMMTESLNHQSNLSGEDIGSHGIIMEFTTNTKETIRESLDHRTDIFEVGSGGDTLDFRTNLLEMTKEAPDLQSGLCIEDLGGIERDTSEVGTNLVQTSEEALEHRSNLCGEDAEYSSTGHDCLHSADLNSVVGADITQSQEENLHLRAVRTEMNSDSSNHQLDAELKDNEDEKIPDTPNSIDSLHQLHRRLLLLEKRNSGSTEESLDGSVMSEIEVDEGTLSVEKLKSALRAERKALHALYAEFEEERSASAVAASQTMAMINRLQEEKAAMQMEALQYQRMMEEQSEYDQEALQLLNDLLVKREREKEELEKELEEYRRKVENNDGKEKKAASMVVAGDGNDSSDSFYNEEDDDEISVYLKEEVSGEDPMDGHGNTPNGAVFSLEDSSNFDEGRASILKKLKNLEENILNVNGEGEAEQWHCKENGNGYVKICNSNGEVDGLDNGHCRRKDIKHYHRHARFAAPAAKRLLPLFDALEEEVGEDCLQKTLPDHFKVGDEKIAVIEEDVDHIYERLQVLEADSEFLKHCLGSLRKGDKGLELLGEILQHLRDLRCAELQGRDIIIGGDIMQY